MFISCISKGPPPPPGALSLSCGVVGVVDTTSRSTVAFPPRSGSGSLSLATTLYFNTLLPGMRSLEANCAVASVPAKASANSDVHRDAGWSAVSCAEQSAALRHGVLPSLPPRRPRWRRLGVRLHRPGGRGAPCGGGARVVAGCAMRAIATLCRNHRSQTQTHKDITHIYIRIIHTYTHLRLSSEPPTTRRDRVQGPDVDRDREPHRWQMTRPGILSMGIFSVGCH